MYANFWFNAFYLHAVVSYRIGICHLSINWGKESCPDNDILSKITHTYCTGRKDNKAGIFKQSDALVHSNNNIILNISRMNFQCYIFLNLVKLKLFAAARNHKGFSSLTLIF